MRDLEFKKGHLIQVTNSKGGTCSLYIFIYLDIKEPYLVPSDLLQLLISGTFLRDFTL